MFLDAWKRKSIKRRIGQLQREERAVPSDPGISKVGILVDYREFRDTGHLRSLAENLGANINCEILVFCPKKKEAEQLSESCFSADDFNIMGKITGKNILDFLEQPFDLLISYYRSENVLLQLITAQAKAGLKAGFPDDDFHLNDLAIHVPVGEINSFESELKKYLKILNRLK